MGRAVPHTSDLSMRESVSQSFRGPRGDSGRRSKQKEAKPLVGPRGQSFDQVDASDPVSNWPPKDARADQHADSVRCCQIRRSKNGSKALVPAGGHEELRIRRHDLVQSPWFLDDPSRDLSQRLRDGNIVEGHTEQCRPIVSAVIAVRSESGHLDGRR